jgi:O-antigen/teichoic acid export membrane protein
VEKVRNMKISNLLSHHLIKRIFSVALWSGVSKILLFTISIIIARILEPVEYGKYILFMVILNTIVNVFDLRLSQVVIPEMKQISNKKLLSFLNFNLEIIMAFLGFIILFICVLFDLDSYIKLDISNFELFLSFLFILSFHIQRSAITIFQANEEYNKYNLITIMFPLIFLISILVFKEFIINYNTAIEYRVYSLVVLAIIAIILIYKYTFFNELKKNKQEFINMLKILIKYSQVSMFIGWMSLIYYNADRLMIGWLGNNSAEVGYYVNGVLLGTLLTHFSGAIVQAIYPNFSKAYLENDIKKVKNYLIRYNHFVFFIIIPIAIILAYFSKEIILFFFGEKYIEASNVFKIWILFIPIYIWPALLIKIVYIRKEHKQFLPYIFLAVITNIILDYFLIPKYGIIGAVGATIVCYSINMIFAFKIAKKYLKVKNENNIYI